MLTEALNLLSAAALNTALYGMTCHVRFQFSFKVCLLSKHAV